MPLMRALHRQVFANGTIETGETFEASAHEARVLVALQRAAFADKGMAVEQTVETPPVKRQYKRRDVQSPQYQTK